LNLFRLRKCCYQTDAAESAIFADKSPLAKSHYMNPVSPDSDNEHSQQPESVHAEESGSLSKNSPPPIAHNRRWNDNPVSPLENLQRRYTDQLSRDIEQLEAEKARLQADVAILKEEHTQLQADSKAIATTDAQATEAQATDAQATADSIKETVTNSFSGSISSSSPIEKIPAVESVRTAERGPRLPGEKEIPPPSIMASSSVRMAVSSSVSSSDRSIELPTPATSQQRRQQRISRRVSPVSTTVRRGLVMSAIATLITSWHYGLVSTVHQGGSWLGVEIGQLGVGFVPAVALLWLRMVVIVPSMVLLAPQLHRTTWEDLLDWFYSRERLLVPLVGSGSALFFSQVFLYQSLGAVGPAIGTALFFLYPLSAVPLGLWLRQEKAPAPFGWLAMVAIAMGGLLVAKPAFTHSSGLSSTAMGLGLLASLALGIYVVFTNRCYRLRCHPIPTAIVQFSTVAVLSSLVLLVKPLKLANISWLSFCLWGLLIGVLMLFAYLLTYASLLNIRSKTAVVAATTPLVALAIGFSFAPRPPLQIIQWTGIALVAIGGAALGQEKLRKGKEPGA